MGQWITKSYSTLLICMRTNNKLEMSKHHLGHYIYDVTKNLHHAHIILIRYR